MHLHQGTKKAEILHMANIVTLKSLDGKIDKAVDDLSEIIQSFAQHVDERFNKVEKEISVVRLDITDLKVSQKSF